MTTTTNYANHYEWLHKNLEKFFAAIGLPHPRYQAQGLVRSHGDKGYGYREFWIAQGISFNHGMAIYLLSYCPPYDKQVRGTDSGWIDIAKWVTEIYPKFKDILNSLDGVCRD